MIFVSRAQADWLIAHGLDPAAFDGKVAVITDTRAGTTPADATRHPRPVRRSI